MTQPIYCRNGASEPGVVVATAMEEDRHADILFADHHIRGIACDVALERAVTQDGSGSW
jgi:hypothetical protein